jgi:hypothetical protein
LDIGLVHQDILSGAIVYIYASWLAGVGKNGKKFSCLENQPVIGSP